ncbi:uncharacterized protein LOC113465078 [Ceratina calcarata]|uniref:Uncharacterized protein LOC113465078 n=1 Tax=Ceratina calcarata TaxID=156304 RepID=A0AAJ7SBG1_9HYME|nr:uncharacterized protein LOC113465078 [Ceratina calcarata]
MGLVNAVYSWPSVKALYFTVFSMNLAGMLALVLAILWAVRFERGFGDHLNLIAPGDGHAWTAVIILAALSCSPAYFLGIKCWLLLRLEPARDDLEQDQQRVDGAVDPHEVNRLLFLHVVACLVSGFLIAILNATYLVLSSGFQQKCRDGLAGAIERYSSDIAVKMRVDAVQTELECCGDNSYEDWFRVPWLRVSADGSEDAETGPRLEEPSAVEEREEESTTPVDVPFSCCSNDIPRPCVHHDVMSPSAVYNYDPKHLTIATEGCRSKIIHRAEVIRIYLAGYLALSSLYQMVLSVMARFLQTAHSNELYLGPQKTRYHAWIFFKPDDLSGHTRTVYPRRRRSRRMLPVSSRKGSDQENASTRRCKNRRSDTKVTTKIRSKISNVKSKSLPAVKSVFSSKDSRGKRVARRSEEEIDAEEEEKLLPNRVAKSEVVVTRDHRSVFSLTSNDASIGLPPPPPPPPFSIVLDVEDERDEDQTPVEKTALSRSSRTETIVDRAFNRNILANLNSGRRIKVLERFGAIWERSDRNPRHRESGGADNSDGSRCGSRSVVTKRSRTKASSTDIYDRFRGTLQHTLARREAVRVRREFKNIHGPAVERNSNVRRSNVVARLKCNDVPPSYRLLANIDRVRKRNSQVPQRVPLPPPPLPPVPNPWTRETKVSPRERRRCSVCNRPVQPSPSSSGGSLVEPPRDVRWFRDPPMRTAREDYAARDGSAFVSEAFQHRWPPVKHSYRHRSMNES